MRTDEQKLVERYRKQHSRRSIWRQIVRTMACIVVFCTTYALILPAITTEQTYHCGLEAHEHSAQCYDHTGSTYGTDPTDATDPTGATGADTETASAEPELICPLAEHVHTGQCRSDPEADLETAEDWEKTLAGVTRTGQWDRDLRAVAQSQIGYRESSSNYLAEEGQELRGYTRYGAWYGVPYGRWNAMFVSFCLYYAGIPEEALPRGSDPGTWMEEIAHLEWFVRTGAPAPGDPVFFRDGPEGALRVGITAEVEASYDESGNAALLRLEVVEGDRDDSVVQSVLDVNACVVEGFVRLDKAQSALYALQPSGTEEPDTSAAPSAFDPSVTDPSVTDPSVSDTASGSEPDSQPTVPVQMTEPSRPDVTAPTGLSPLAAGASVTLDFTSWSQWNAISFPNGNNYTCEVGSTITIVLGDSSANYVAPSISVTGGELVSAGYTCDTAGCSHSNWCGSNPRHTFVVKITSSTAKITGSVQGANWSNNSVTITAPGSGGGETEPTTAPTTPTPETTTPTETTTPPETTRPPETTAPTTPVVPNYPYYPDAVTTGGVQISRLRFYNLCENGDSGVSALAGCEFEIRGDNGYTATVISGDSPEVNLPGDIPDGNYTITEVSTPDGYMRDEEYERTFVVKNGALASTNNIGTFINHHLDQLQAGKTGEVEDYNNRIYQVLLFAESHMRKYEMDPVDVLFVVDQSNSMLFPSGLNKTGKSVKLNFNGSGNIANMEALNLDKTQHYYIISDPKGTSTVWSIWYNGQSWMYQDASYYSKAKHNNATGYQDPNERAIFPQNRSYKDQANAEATDERSNGGGLGYSLDGSGLGKYLAANGNSLTFELYTATDEYNRLHYLEQALENMIYELADINSENRVTLTRFTKTVDEDNDCDGPLKLTPENAEYLVSEVSSINTSGGTRQDIALKHVYEKHLSDSSKGYNSDPKYNYTILITDGAPVLSSGSDIDNLGGPDDPASTTANSVYAQIKGYANEVKKYSQLMTVGLGMESVDAGKDVLQQIASSNDFYCALDDASELVKSMQRLLFDGMRPKDSIEIYGDITDRISDSFYPIAYTAPGAGAATGRQVLVADGARDWILLQEGDWITPEGAYAQAGSAEAVGQLQREADGTFCIRWNNQQLSDPYLHQIQRIAWVAAGKGSSSGRTFIGSDGEKDWILLNAGDYISQEGEYYAGTPSYWNRRYYGQVTESGGNYSITWGSSASAANRQYYTSLRQWKGTFYVKAKEDFIGGNAIDTNKSANVTVHGAVKNLPTPTVNVRLLDLNEHRSEVTVYLGDIINAQGHAPVDSLMAFYEDIRFTKLIADGGDVMNAVTADSDPADGLEAAVFDLGYAMGRELTLDEWKAMMAGETITVPYTYDDSSSHGAVGEFTFRLEKEGSGSDYTAHRAQQACQPGGQPLTEHCEAPAETYRLIVTYTAYGLDENGRPEENVHNGTGSPGTEVGTGAALETGLGVVDSVNIHEVHVISGAIQITKRIESDLVSDQAQTFTFTIHRMEDGADTSADRTGTITVPAGSTTATGAITFDNLPRGTYTVTEAASDVYAVKGITVLGSTNCESDPAIGSSAMEVTFVMGNNIAGANVIGKAAQTDLYTVYTDPVNGVFGAAEFVNGKIVYEAEIPVVKVWDDGAENHPADKVYMVLCKDGTPVPDENGYARILLLSASNNWTGSFTVPLKDRDDSLDNYDYSIREVSRVTETQTPSWYPAVPEHDKTTVWYYERLLESGRVLSFDNRGYVVEYAVDENGVWTVTNHRAVELPKTGGMTAAPFHTLGMLLILAAALMYFRITGRNRRKEGR